jgi:predicted CxxxxCH...CXXCH cytochrome family protein
MPRSTFFTNLITAALTFVGVSVWALAPPHNETNSIDCGDCHHLRDNAYGFSDIVTFGKEQEAMCKTCHNPTGVAAAMSEVGTHDVEDGATVVDCGSCHYVHLVNTTTDPHTGGVTAPNLKLIRGDTDRYIPQALTPTIFQSSPDHFSFMEAPATGICQTCHTQTDYHTNDGLGPAHNGGAECKSCHPHDEGFDVACDTCHGNPPVVDVPQGQDGLVVSPAPTGSATAGAHGAHVNTTLVDNGIDCATCHDDHKFGGLSHISDSTITLSFVLETNHIGGTYDGQASAGYDTSDPANTTVTNGDTVTCTVYCHSNVQSADGTAEATVYTLPTWDSTGALACTSCHGNPPNNANHTVHVNSTHHGNGYWGAIGCDTCHASNTHIDGNIDVKTSLGYTHGGSPGNGYGLCANACHWGALWDGDPLWQCYDCHGSDQTGMGGSPSPNQDPPVLIPEGDIISATSVPVTLEWNVVPPLSGWGEASYYAQVSVNSNFSYPIAYTLNWTTNTSWTVNLSSSHTWYWRVRARDVARPNKISTWATDSFDIRACTDCPTAPLLINEPDYSYVWAEGPSPVTLEWNPVTAPDADPVEYYVEVYPLEDLSVVDFSSGWISGTDFTFTPESLMWYWWRVKARDAVHTTYESGWSFVDQFIDTYSSSCPFLYVWDGEKFVFQTDLYGPGKLAAKGKFGYFKPNPHDYYVLETNPVAQDGQYHMRLVEERFETDYMDELKLYMMDFPVDREVYAEKPGFGGTLEDLQDVLHTVATVKQNPVTITHINTGDDVSAQIADSDGNYLVLNNDKNLDFEYQTLELDLGDLSAAPQVKLIIDGVTVFPSTPEGTARSAQFGPRTKLEVLDENGQWVSVPKTTAELPKPPEMKRVFVLDISDIFLTDDFRVRLTFLFKTYIDAIHFDTTQDETIVLNEIPLTSAELRSYGMSNSVQVYEDIFNYVYEETNPNHIHEYFPGNYTRYGDVTMLLSQTDDKFVIYGLGDEIDLRFDVPAYQPLGIKRRFLMYTNGYYKDAKVDVAHTVEPLPFAAMSNFPYDEAVENYPDDPEHTQYLNEYNTRVE